MRRLFVFVLGFVSSLRFQVQITRVLFWLTWLRESGGFLCLFVGGGGGGGGSAVCSGVGPFVARLCLTVLCAWLDQDLHSVSSTVFSLPKLLARDLELELGLFNFYLQQAPLRSMKLRTLCGVKFYLRGTGWELEVEWVAHWQTYGSQFWYVIPVRST